MNANRPIIIGLTGGSGSGKSIAAEFLYELGCAWIDLDSISRSLTAPGGAALPEIRRYFGDGVFNSDGCLDRRALADLVFSDPDKKNRLENILHPMIIREAVSQIESSYGSKAIILDVPLLFESGMDSLCDETWAMSAPDEVRIGRILERDGISRAQAIQRISNQLSNAEREALATRVISSDRPPELTRTELKAALEKAVLEFKLHRRNSRHE